MATILCRGMLVVLSLAGLVEILTWGWDALRPTPLAQWCPSVWWVYVVTAVLLWVWMVMHAWRNH